ncbi:MAG: hypothetical protein AAFR82_02840 [Pseudomonadota bacterium]
MDTIEQNLAIWQDSLLTNIPIAGLLSRNPIAYKWKAPFRCWLLREAAFWRATDLLKQSHRLHQQGHGLGARILLRSAFETLATLIYLNLKIQAVLDGKLDFHQFGELTTRLTVGSKREDDGPQAVNVLTMLGKGDEKYPGLRDMYDSLSESAHPNFEGMIWGYSKVDHDEYETNFSNRWMDLYGNRQLNSMELCMTTFHHEYDEVWTKRMNDLEGWIAINDDKLEATKNDAPKH